MAVTVIIRDIKVRAVVAPLKRPVRTAVGTIPSAPLVLIDVLTSDGSAGRSYIFAYTAAALVPLARLVSEIAEELKGKSIAPALRCENSIGAFGWLGGRDLLGWPSPASTWRSGMPLRER
jgi:mandelate racemase